jgi:hypothetical protein
VRPRGRAAANACHVTVRRAFGGGYVYGNVCGLGGGQDERLMIYMPEVTALVFFLSASHTPDQGNPRPQMRVPFWILGARSLTLGLDGQGRFDTALRPDETVPLAADVAHVDIDGQACRVSTTRPFLALMSLSQVCHARRAPPPPISGQHCPHP